MNPVNRQRYPDDAESVTIYGNDRQWLGAVCYRRALIGWRVDGRWCLTRKMRDHEIRARTLDLLVKKVTKL